MRWLVGPKETRDDAEDTAEHIMRMAREIVGGDHEAATRSLSALVDPERRCGEDRRKEDDRRRA